MATAGRRYLVEGDVAAGTVRTVTENVECPSLSPDGTRIAFKQAIDADPTRGWRLSVLDLATLRVVPLAETNSVDDQAAWLDNATVAYTQRDSTGDPDIWAVPADGSGLPRLLCRTRRPPPRSSRRHLEGARSPPLGSAVTSIDREPVRSVHDRAELAAMFLRDPALHAYELGDLDDFFWPYTTWYRRADNVALVYHGSGLPTLLALAGPDHLGGLTGLLRSVLPLLPRRVYAHVSVGAGSVVAEHFPVEPHGLHLKMALTDPHRLAPMDVEAVQLGRANLPELLELYAAAYPGNWFDPRMLDTGQYVGVRRDGALVAVAGVHVWSPVYRVATLGNVTTHPRVRGQGAGRAAVTALCQQLMTTVDHIALNVKADNAAAIGLYAGLGFSVIGEYDELMLG